MNSKRTLKPVSAKKDSAVSSSSVRQKSNSERAELESLIHMVTDLVGNQPEKAAIILADWIKKPSQTQNKKKDAA